MLRDRLGPYVKAGFSGVWVTTSEPEEAQREVNLLAHALGRESRQWDIGRGLVVGDAARPGSDNPLAPLTGLPNGGQGALVTLHNYHRFLDNAKVVQCLANALLAAKEDGNTFLVLSPALSLPPELEKTFVVIDHDLPTRDQLLGKLGDIEGDVGYEDGVGDAAVGLTLREAENAYALSLVKHGKVTVEEVLELKTQAVKKKGFLELYRGKESFSSLGGLGGAKDFCARLLRKGNPVAPRGILLVGVPGSGKSAFIKALGNEVDRPTLLMDVGRLHSKYVGESEANLRGALRLADSLAPCVLFIDEVEKALSGVGSDGDSGVSARVFGSLLTWMNDRESDVFVALSANDVTRLPPEFSRAERLDRVFMVDLPTGDELDRIWEIYRGLYGVPDLHLPPNDSQWTGAEVKSCCRLSRALGVSLTEASKGLVPVAASSADKIHALREWAKGKVTDASTGEIYMGPDAKVKAQGKRRVWAKGAG